VAMTTSRECGEAKNKDIQEKPSAVQCIGFDYTVVVPAGSVAAGSALGSGETGLPRLPLQPALADGGDLMSPCSCSCCCSLNAPTCHKKQEQAITTFSNGESL
jgi:hypothetical protein